MTDIIETMARAYRDADAGSFRLGDVLPTYYVSRAQAAIAALTEAGYVIVPREPTEAMLELGLFEAESCTNDWTASAACLPGHVWKAMVRAAQAIESRSGETEGLDPQGESAVGVTDAPNHIMPPIRVSGPLESEEGE